MQEDMNENTLFPLENLHVAHATTSYNCNKSIHEVLNSIARL